MLEQHTDTYTHTQFGIDEVYIHGGLGVHLLKKLQQRAEITLDNTDSLVAKHATQDMILIFHRRVPSQNLIYRFLKFLHQSNDEKVFLESHTLLNEEELFEAIKSKNFVLVTTKNITEE